MVLRYSTPQNAEASCFQGEAVEVFLWHRYPVPYLGQDHKSRQLPRNEGALW